MKRWLKRVGLLLLWLVIAFLVLEIVLRFVVADWAWVATMEFDRPDPPCFGMRPGSSGVYEGWWTKVRGTRVQINSRGLRDAEYPPRPAAGVLRLAALGDSHVFGLGTELEEGIPRQLARELSRRLSRPVEVINAGVPGYDLAKEVDLLPRVLEAYAPAVVLLFIDDGDLTPVPCEFWKNRVRPLLRYSVAVRALHVLVLRTINRPAVRSSEPERLAELERQLARVADLVARPDLSRPRVVFIKLRPLADAPAGEAAFDAAIRARGFAVVSSAEMFRWLLGKPEEFVVVGEGHLNARGISRLVTAVAEDLVRDGLVR